MKERQMILRTRNKYSLIEVDEGKSENLMK